MTIGRRHPRLNLPIDHFYQQIEFQLKESPLWFSITRFDADDRVNTARPVGPHFLNMSACIFKQIRFLVHGHWNHEKFSRTLFRSGIFSF